MRRKLIGILFLLFSSFLFAVPAIAADLPQCAPFPSETTEFTLVGQDNIIFEPQQPNSGRFIQGNVLVTNPTPFKVGVNTGTGFVKVGANTDIRGTVIANTILLPDGGAKISHCIANTIVANTPAAKNSCGTGYPVVGTPFTDYATSHANCVEPFTSPLTFASFCGPTPVKDPIAEGKPPISCPPNLPPGVYGALTIEKDATCTLNGVYTFKSIRMKSGADLIGPATVNVNNNFITEAGVSMTDIKLNIALSSTAEIMEIWNNSILTRVDINAPFGKCHVHTGSRLEECSEVCCKILDIQPIIAKCDDEKFVCKCDPGFKFAVPNSTIGDGTVLRECVPCAPGENCP